MNMQSSLNKVYKILSIVFGVVSAVFILEGAIVFAHSKSYIENAELISCTVADIESEIDGNGSVSYRVYVDYTYKGREYKHIELNQYSDSMNRGKEIEVYVDKDDPENVKAKSFVLVLPIVFMLIGAAFGIAASVIVFIRSKNGKMRKALLQNGKKLYGEVRGGVLERTCTVNGKHPYRFECVYYDSLSGQPVICTSDAVWADPEQYIGRQVAIYVDLNDRSRYYVDLETILKDLEGKKGI